MLPKHKQHLQTSPSSFVRRLMIPVFVLYLSLIVIAGVCFAEMPVLTDQQINRLDSLLQAGDIIGIEGIIRKADIQLQAGQYMASEIEYYHQLRAQYQDIIDYVAYFNGDTTGERSRLIAQSMSLGEEYSPEFAGREAAAAFQVFTNMATAGNEIEAVKFFRIARFFRARYFKEVLSRAHRSYLLADEYLRKGQLDEALAAVAEGRYEPGNNVALLAYKDTLNRLEERVVSSIARRDERQHNWGRTELVDYKLSLTIRTSIIPQPGVDDLSLAVGNGSEGDDFVVVDRIARDYKFGLGVDMWYRVSSSLLLGGQADFTRFSYNSSYTTQLVTFQFDVDYYTFHLGAQYLFRNFVGMRPFVNVGTGLIHYNRGEYDYSIWAAPDDTSAVVIVNQGTVESADFDCGRFFMDVGLQYVANQSSRIFFSGRASVFYNFKDDALIQRQGASVAVGVGLLL